jgi:hypothetical protein
MTRSFRKGIVSLLSRATPLHGSEAGIHPRGRSIGRASFI